MALLINKTIFFYIQLGSFSCLLNEADELTLSRQESYFPDVEVGNH